MEKLGVLYNTLLSPRSTIIIVCCILCSCNNGKRKIERDSNVEMEVETARSEKVVEEPERLKLKPVKSKGTGVILERNVDFYDANQIESNLRPKYAELFEILEVSQDRYPKDNLNLCAKFPYVHVSNSRINGWLTGKHVFRIFDEPEMRIKIFSEPYMVYKSKNFGIGSIDSTGRLTGCEEYYPVLLKSLDGKEYRIINLDAGNPIYSSFEFLILSIYDEILDVSTDSSYTVLKIKTEGMEGGKVYDLKLTITDKDLVKGEITNVKDWTF